MRRAHSSTHVCSRGFLLLCLLSFQVVRLPKVFERCSLVSFLPRGEIAFVHCYHTLPVPP